MARCGHCGAKNLTVHPFDPIEGTSLERHTPPWKQGGYCKGPETAYERPVFVSSRPTPPEPISTSTVPHLRSNEIVHIRPTHKGGTTIRQRKSA